MRFKSFDIEKLKTELGYMPETGAFFWKVPKVGRRQIVGHKSAIGYLQIRVQGQLLLGHRIAWAMHYGTQPAVIDHINGDKFDNRIENLRAANDVVNAQNIRTPQKNNTSGYLGVSFCKFTGKWNAQITVDRLHRNLGRFDFPEIAHEAYLAAKRQLHAGCTI